MDELELREAARRALRVRLLTEPVWEAARRDGLVDAALIRRDDETFGDLLSALRSYRRLAVEVMRKPSSRAKAPLQANLTLLESEHSYATSERIAADVRDTYTVRDFRRQVLHGRILGPRAALTFVRSSVNQLVSVYEQELAGVRPDRHRAAIIEQSLAEDGTWRIEVEAQPIGARWWRTGRFSVGRKGIISDGRVIGEEVALVRDGRGRSFHVGCWRMSVVDDLRKRAETLGKSYPWSEPEAIWFMLTDQAPTLHPLQAKMGPGRSGQIALTVSPWISAQSLVRFYHRMQAHALGSVRRKANARNFAVYGFVEKHSTVFQERRGHTMESEEATRRRRKPATWRALMMEWNKSVRNATDRYDDPRRFYRDGKRGWRAIERERMAAEIGGLGRFEDAEKAP